MDLDEARAALAAALGVARIAPPAGELADMVAAYPVAREAMNRLYDIPEVRYVEPAITFDPRG